MRTIVTSMRDEAPFLLEWLAYHQEIGFTDFLVFSNDCADGTDRMLDRLAALGHLRHLPNQRMGDKTVQWQALNRAMGEPELGGDGWVLVSDVDEFLCIHAGEGRLDDLFATAPDAEAFSIPWRMFGNAGVTTMAEAPILRQFTRAAPDRLLWPWRAVQYKTLFRMNDSVARLGVHRPRRRTPLPQGAWLDGSGRVVPDHGGTVILDPAPRYDLAQMNHYALGTLEDFMVKRARGRPNHSDTAIDLAYWIERNLCETEDRRILRLIDAVEHRVAAFLADAELASHHAQGLVWRRERFNALLRDPAQVEFYGQLMQTGPTRILPMDQQRALIGRLLRAVAASPQGPRHAPHRDIAPRG